MSWIRDLDDNLVNLDHVARLEVVEVDNESGGEHKHTHALIARFPNNEEPAAWLLEGNPSQCINKLEAIAKGIHVVRC